MESIWKLSFSFFSSFRFVSVTLHTDRILQDSKLKVGSQSFSKIIDMKSSDILLFSVVDKLLCSYINFVMILTIKVSLENAYYVFSTLLLIYRYSKRQIRYLN